MRLSTKIIVGAAVVAAAVAAASFGASAPAAAAEQVLRTQGTDMSARKKRSAKRHQATSLRVTKLSRRAADPPNPNRTYYRPVPSFYPFAQDRGYF